MRNFSVMGDVVASAGREVTSGGDDRTGATTVVAWSPGNDMDARAWVKTGQRLGAMSRCSQWWLGDWVRYGNGRWGEKYKEASRITGYDVQSLRNMAYVAGRIEISRRRYNLTWSHHAEVTALDIEEQERWLELAEAERMSVADLRIELRSARRVERRLAAPEQKMQLEAPRIMCPRCRHEFTPAADSDTRAD